MQIERLTDPAEFLRRARPVIDAAPALHSVTVGVAHDLLRDPGRCPDRAFFLVRREGRPPFLAHHAPPFTVHLPAGDADAARALADRIEASWRRPAGVGGHRTSAEAFAERWCGRTRQAWELTARHSLYDLPDAPRLSRPVRGRPRVAGPEDLDLLDSWSTAFVAEVVGKEPPPGATNRLGVDEGRVLIWCDPGPVAMALATRDVGGVVRIGGVYTPPGRRGHGYGTAVTVAISENRRRLGFVCVLHTDPDADSGAIRAIGYRALGEIVELLFLDRPRRL